MSDLLNTTATGEQEITALVTEALAISAGVPADRVDPDGTLGDIPGMESVKALRAVSRIEESLRIVLPDDFLFETATVAELAAFVTVLAREQRAREGK
ncbi:acyl carrier protein [Kitasatospora sp. NPDC093558]|uniref:acyl carrier protein n=1 Tax=Kitasatospora sp. NPDC093558 TaxID=3155201 RepID=UPI003445DC1A